MLGTVGLQGGLWSARGLFVMNRATVCVFLTTILHCSVPTAAQGIVSDAVGLGALNRIIADKDLQVEFEISPKQLDSLVKLLNSKEVAEGLPRDPFKATGLVIFGIDEEDFGGAQFSSKKLKDEIVAQELAMLLEPSQFEAIRLSVLRRRVRFPLDALSVGFLAQVGLTNVEIEAARARIAGSVAKVEEQLRELRTMAVVAIMGAFPAESRKKFVHCFGRGYLSSSSSGDAFDISSFGLFQMDHGEWAMMVALSLFNPNSTQPLIDAERFTDQQFLKLNRSMKEISAKSLNEPAFNAEKAADEALESILTEPQRSALGQRQNQFMLETDLNNIMKPQVVGYLQLSNDLRPWVAAECQKWQEEINALRLKLEVEVFKTAVSESPREVRSILIRLYDQVWCDLN
jgi:hypothetical protein